MAIVKVVTYPEVWKKPENYPSKVMYWGQGLSTDAAKSGEALALLMNKLEGASLGFTILSMSPTKVSKGGSTDEEKLAELDDVNERLQWAQWAVGISGLSVFWLNEKAPTLEGAVLGWVHAEGARAAVGTPPGLYSLLTTVLRGICPGLQIHKTLDSLMEEVACRLKDEPVSVPALMKCPVCAGTGEIEEIDCRVLAAQLAAELGSTSGDGFWACNKLVRPVTQVLADIERVLKTSLHAQTPKEKEA